MELEERKMRELHLLCNAHIDPVWQWQRQDGMAEAISTFRVAARFCEEYDGFIFNHNESLIYEWVEENEPELFDKIKKLVADGKWHIMGGWYLQPDCLMPSGESFIRQIQTGYKYFMDKFGVKASTAINFDPFGHTRGLVQIMKKAGFDSYVFLRPSDIIPEHDFIWKGFDGSEVIGHNTLGGYNTNRGEVTKKLENAIANSYSDGANMMLWGIGNHGGGPSEIDIELIEEFKKNHPDIKIIHSWCENYFSQIDKTKLRKVEQSLVHCMVGCYTSMVRIKQLHRKLENELTICEKMLAMSGIDYDNTEFEKAEKALMFNQFHDILPGSSIKIVEEDSIRLFNYGSEIVSKLCAKAFFKLCSGQFECKRGEIPVLVFNPNPYVVETIVEVGFMLEDQNWNMNEVTLATVRNENGEYLSTQNIKEASSINLDWSKRIAFKTSLKPMSMNRFDCELKVIENSVRRLITPCKENDTHFIVMNDSMVVEINKKSGLVDRYCVDGFEYLKPESGKIKTYCDNEDPWGSEINGFYNCIGEFKTVTDDRANCFNGYPEETLPNVRVIENGDVYCKIQAIFNHDNSFAVVTYTIPKQGKYIDIKIKMNVADSMRMYKLSFNTTFETPYFVGQTAFGREKLAKNEQEVTYQKWCGLFENDKGLTVLNRGTYGGSAKDNVMNISLLRTPICCTLPVEDRPFSEPDRNNDFIDMGERNFEYRLTTEVAHIDSESEIYNQQPYTLSFFPSGNGETIERSVYIENQDIIMSRCKSVDSGKLLVRLFNSKETENRTKLWIEGNVFTVDFKLYEFKTFIYGGEGELRECGLMDDICL